MSVKVMGLVWDHFPSDRGELVLALALSDHADHEGYCSFGDTSIPSLSKKTRLSERQVQRQLRALEGSGWLLCVHRSTGGRNAVNRYRINPTWIETPAEFVFRTSPQQENGDILSPLTVTSDVTVSPPETVTPCHRLPPETVTFSTGNGDIAMSPAYIRKPNRNSKALEISKRESNPADGVAEPSAIDGDDAEDRRLAEWMVGLLRQLDQKFRDPNWRRWCREIRLMRERDDRTQKEIAALFRWANADNFWQTNILSPSKLRLRWEQLVIAQSSEARKRAGAMPQAVDRRCSRVLENGERCSRKGTFGMPDGSWFCDPCAEAAERHRAEHSAHQERAC